MQRRVPVVVIIVSMIWCLAGPETKSDSQRGSVADKLSDGPSFPGAALVYSRPMGDHMEVMWKHLGAAEARTVYKSGSCARVPLVPYEFGYLPSPDGSYLIVWETTFTTDTFQPESASWWLLSLPRGPAVPLAESEGDASFLPWWPDAHHLVLEGEETVLEPLAPTLAYDTRKQIVSRTARLKGSVPSGVVGPREEGLARARLRAYCYAHYGRCLAVLKWEIEAWPAQMQGLLRCLRRGDSDELEDMILRDLGIPTFGQVEGFLLRKRHYPSVACSRDGVLMALAYIDETRSSGTGQAGGGTVAAVLDVIPTRTGTRKRVASAIWPGWTAMSEEVVPPAIPGYVQPYFGDVRWSWDNRYLGFTERGKGSPTVVVLAGPEWKEIERVSNAQNAFVIPVAPKNP